MQNIHDIDEDHLMLTNRASNTLKKHNITMSKKFPYAHPDVNVFVEALEEEVR